MRNIIVHYHIFKNAGSSIDFILKKNFGNLWMAFDRSKDGEIIPKEDLEKLILDNPEIMVVSSHQLRPPIPTNAEFNVIPIFMLRHPIARVRSIYNYERSEHRAKEIEEKGRMHTIMANKFSFKEYIEWAVRKTKGASIRNYQTICLSCVQAKMQNPWSVIPDASHLAEAKKFLESVPFIGIVERFDESISIFNKKISPLFDKLEFFYAKTNFSQSHNLSIEENLSAIKKEIGEALYKELEEANKFDIELYKLATVKFDKLLKEIA